MESDHLPDALLYLRSALGAFAGDGKVSRFDIEGAIRHIEAEIRLRGLFPLRLNGSAVVKGD